MNWTIGEKLLHFIVGVYVTIMSCSTVTQTHFNFKNNAA